MKKVLNIKYDMKSAVSPREDFVSVINDIIGYKKIPTIC